MVISKELYNFFKFLFIEILENKTIFKYFLLYFYTLIFLEPILAKLRAESVQLFYPLLSSFVFTKILKIFIFEISILVITFIKLFLEICALDYVSHLLIISMLYSFSKRLNKTAYIADQKAPMIDIYTYHLKHGVQEAIDILIKYFSIIIKVGTQIAQCISILTKIDSGNTLLFTGSIFSFFFFSFFISFLVRYFFYSFWIDIIKKLYYLRTDLNVRLSTINYYSEEMNLFSGEPFEIKGIENKIFKLQKIFIQDNIGSLFFRTFNFFSKKKTKETITGLFILYFFISLFEKTVSLDISSKKNLLSALCLLFEVATMPFNLIEKETLQLPHLHLLGLGNVIMDKKDKLLASSLKNYKSLPASENKISFKNLRVGTAELENLETFGTASFDFCSIVYTAKSIKNIIFSLAKIWPFEGEISCPKTLILAEHPYLFDSRNIYEVLYFKKIGNISKKEIIKANEYLVKFRLDKFLDNKRIIHPRKLGCGEQQRISIISGLLTNKPLILESPTNYLDPLNEAILYQEIIDSKIKYIIFTSRSTNLDLFPKVYTL